MAHFSLEEYKKNIKGFRLEEPFDFLVFRPIAYIIVKSTYFLPLTPDHFSLLGLFAALISSYLLLESNPTNLFWAGVGIFFFAVFDCCDGMLARLKKNGSKYGTLIDMLVDVLASSGIYISFFYGLKKTNPEAYWPFLVLICAFFILLHASIYNYYKKQYFYYQEKNPEGQKEEIEKCLKEYQQLQKNSGHLFEKTLLKLYLIFNQLQERSSTNQKTKNTERYTQLNKNMILFWGVGSGSTHLFILSLCLVFNQPWPYFIFAIFFSNFALIYIYSLQRKVDQKLALEAY